MNTKKTGTIGYHYQARIRSLEGNFDDVIIERDYTSNQTKFTALYKNKRCTAIYNIFTNSFYVDDVYNYEILKEID